MTNLSTPPALHTLHHAQITVAPEQEADAYRFYQRHRKTSSVHGEDIPSEGHK